MTLGVSARSPHHAAVAGVHAAPTLKTMAPHEQRVGGSTLNERILGRGWELIQPIETAYQRGEIEAHAWHARIGAIIGPAYLSATDPRAQSGFSGSAEDWDRARRFLFAAVNRDGTFLDVGCANGHLMECSVAWLAEAGVSIEPYGLEILPELAALARQRLPHWADRIATGNALDWTPVRPFDFVRTGLEYVPARLRAQLVAHLLEHVVAPGGRLIVGAHSEAAGSPPHLQAQVASWGLSVAGAIEVPHAGDHRVVRRAFWLEKPGVQA
jgi:SAM-dependent methyltransferase